MSGDELDDEEVYGDFEDLETGAQRAAGEEVKEPAAKKQKTEHNVTSKPT